jgi:hypothetical protein
MSGVPVGTQVAIPVMMATGWPCDSTCCAPIIHCAVAQGPLPAGGTKGQPAMLYGAAMVAMGMPLTMTTGLGVVGIAWPPCAQRTTAPMCNIGAGIQAPSTVKAPKLMSTVGPIKLMLAMPGPALK